MKRLIVWLALLFCVTLFVGCSNTGIEADMAGLDGGEGILDYANTELSSGGDQWDDLPGGLRPMIMVNGKFYHWTGISKEHHILATGEVYTVGDSSTILPDGYVAVGEISSITEEVPSEEMQMRAAFEAIGTVFTNENTPEVIYVLMTTSWFDDCYIRFASDDLHDNECISYQGRQYRINIDTAVCEIIKELPEECVLIGTLQYIGGDTIPANDLETNRIADGHGNSLDGREIYADPSDSNVLYVYEHHYWAQGDYPTWRVCHLWTK